mmetsp:Transcript_16423/g.46592  ORF Transcript_16423/g.46592 Transcript_16423/m.46592 type:complete len:234 (-) Transcript_16423:66-767(-)
MERARRRDDRTHHEQRERADLGARGRAARGPQGGARRGARGAAALGIDRSRGHDVAPGNAVRRRLLLWCAATERLGPVLRRRGADRLFLQHGDGRDVLDAARGRHHQARRRARGAAALPRRRRAARRRAGRDAVARVLGRERASAILVQPDHAGGFLGRARSKRRREGSRGAGTRSGRYGATGTELDGSYRRPDGQGDVGQRRHGRGAQGGRRRGGRPLGGLQGLHRKEGTAR